MSLKIVIFTNHFAPEIGGCEAVTGKIAEYLAQRGHEVFIGTRRIRERNPRDYPNFHIIEYMANRYREFEMALGEIKPDVIFVYSDVFDFTRQLLSYDTKRIIIALCGANWLYANRNYVNFLLYRCPKKLDRLICHSQHDRDYKLCSVTKLKDKTVVIPNGVDLDEFQSNTLSRQDLLPELSDKPWLLNVSNFFPGKGQHHLVDILNLLPEKKKFVYIQVASDISFAVGAKLEKEWEKRCKLDLNPNITVVLKKNSPRSDVVGFFNNSNVFMLPSEKEVAPIVLLEAMAAGLPWVSADVGNSKDLAGGHFIPAVRNTNYYSVIDGRVKKLFAAAIKRLHNNPAVGEQGRQQITDKLSWEKILPQYASIIER